MKKYGFSAEEKIRVLSPENVSSSQRWRAGMIPLDSSSPWGVSPPRDGTP